MKNVLKSNGGKEFTTKVTDEEFKKCFDKYSGGPEVLKFLNDQLVNNKNDAYVNKFMNTPGFVNFYELKEKDTGNTYVHLAVEGDCPELIKYFIEKSLVSFGLEKYIIKFSVVKNKPYMGSYNQEEKSININMDIFEKKYLNDRECINLFPNETNRYLVVNMLLIGTIMHEITHARQYKSCCEHQKSIIAKLTSDGFDFEDRKSVV